MGRIRGHYEWDDDDLTPGRKKEGGLHQNLFDADGHLKGNARFVPEDDPEPKTVLVTETVFITADQRRETRDDDVIYQLAAEMTRYLLDRGIERAKPVVAQWWNETARPAMAARRARVSGRIKARKAKKSEAVGPTAAQSGVRADQRSELVERDSERPSMSSAEAQARYLAALAARAFSEEQMRLVGDARIVGVDGLAELEQALAALPVEQLRALIAAIAANPALLREPELAQLASLLSRRGTGRLESGR